MKDNYADLKEVAINNNCPECYSNDGLHIHFKQKIVETKFYRSITPEIKHEITCKTCNSVIYPVSWTDDIDRVFSYHQKALEPMKSSTYIKKNTWIVAIAILLVVALAAFLIFKAEL